jgi:hypothetical protein
MVLAPPSPVQNSNNPHGRPSKLSLPPMLERPAYLARIEM